MNLKSINRILAKLRSDLNQNKSFIYHYNEISNFIYSILGHKGYKKFVIVSSGRSGSTFLETLLNSHPNIRSLSEIFHERELDPKTVFYYPKSRKQHKLFIDDPQRFLDVVLYNRYFHKDISYVGFKILYYQTRFHKQASVWPYLADHKEIKIIHLKRNNLLAQYLSLVRAKKTDTWTQWKTRKDSYEPVTLRLKECVGYFRAMENFMDETDWMFLRHDVKEVRYEDLVADRERQLGDILDFLGVQNHTKLYTGLIKQNPLPLSQSIANYEGLKRQLLGTKYGAFFTD